MNTMNTTTTSRTYRAKSRFRYRGHVIEPGDVLTCPTRDALYLKNERRVVESMISPAVRPKLFSLTRPPKEWHFT
jgi:hypothetical protein